MGVINIVRIVGSALMGIYLSKRILELMKLQKEDPQYYVKRKLLYIEMWVVAWFFFLFVKYVVIGFVIQ